MRIPNKIWNALVFLILSLLVFGYAGFLYLDILIPDTPRPNDPKPNLERELRPIFETVVCILGSISIALSVISILILRSYKKQV